MEREITVRVNYVLGSNGAFVDAAGQAEHVNQKVASAASSIRSHVERSGSMFARLLTGGIGTLAGGAIAGNIAGLASSELAMGGGGIRGHGFSGLNDSFWGMVTGRGTREALTDMKMQAASTFSGMVGQRLGLQSMASDLGTRFGYTPSTQVDPYLRIEEERSLMKKRMGWARSDQFEIEKSYGPQRATMVSLNAQAVGDNDKLAGSINLHKLDAEYLKNRAEFSKQDLARATELNQLDKQVFEQRKGMMRAGRMNWASMTFGDQQYMRITRDEMRAGKDLTPHQHGMMRSVPEFEQEYNKYVMEKDRKSGKDGYNEFISGSGGEMGRAVMRSKALKQGLGFDVPAEDLLESGVEFAASTSLVKTLSKVVAQVFTSLQEKEKQLTQETQKLMNENRRALGDRP